MLVLVAIFSLILGMSSDHANYIVVSPSSTAGREIGARRTDRAADRQHLFVFYRDHGG